MARVRMFSEIKSVAHTVSISCLAFDQFTSVLGQADQHVHHLELDLDRFGVAGETVQPRLDQPLPETERSMSNIGTFDFQGHFEINVGLKGSNDHEKVPAGECGRRGLGMKTDGGVEEAWAGTPPAAKADRRW